MRQEADGPGSTVWRSKWERRDGQGRREHTSCPAVTERRVSLSRWVSAGVSAGPGRPLLDAGRGQAAPVPFARRTEAVLAGAGLVSLLAPLHASILQVGSGGTPNPQRAGMQSEESSSHLTPNIAVDAENPYEKGGYHGTCSDSISLQCSPL